MKSLFTASLSFQQLKVVSEFAGDLGLPSSLASLWLPYTVLPWWPAGPGPSKSRGEGRGRLGCLLHRGSGEW